MQVQREVGEVALLYCMRESTRFHHGGQGRDGGTSYHTPVTRVHNKGIVPRVNTLLEKNQVHARELGLDINALLICDSRSDIVGIEDHSRATLGSEDHVDVAEESGELEVIDRHVLHKGHPLHNPVPVSLAIASEGSEQATVHCLRYKD